MINAKFYDTMRARWKRALLTTHEGEWLKSEVAVDVFDDPGVAGDKCQAYNVFTKIGVPDQTKATLREMWYARKDLPDRDIWIACGWPGVRRLLSLKGSARSKKIKAIRAEIKKGTKPKRAAAKILPAPKRSAPVNSVKAHAKAMSAPAVNHRTSSLLDTVLADLAKLAAFNPAILDLVSDTTRKAIQSKAKKTA